MWWYSKKFHVILESFSRYRQKRNNKGEFDDILVLMGIKPIIQTSITEDLYSQSIRLSQSYKVVAENYENEKADA